MGEENKNIERDFQRALQDKKIPLLVLDQKWHHMFAEDRKPRKVAMLEKKLNSYLGRQGHLNQELKELKKIKAKLMKNIVVNMDEIGEERQETKRLQEDKRLISDINDRMESYEEELMKLPRLMQEVNQTLMLQTMEYCYGKMRDNEVEKEEIAQWITQIRIELKKKVIRKQTVEYHNKEIYSYMHDIFGALIIDIFDLKYGKEQEENQDEQEKKGQS